MAALKNPRWEKFVQCLFSGMSQRQAYYEAYPNSMNWKPETVDSKAYKLGKRDQIWTRYQELQHERALQAGLTRQRKKLILQEIAENPETSASDRIKAIDIDNKMECEYVSKVDLSGSLSSDQGKIDNVLKQLSEMSDGRDE